MKSINIKGTDYVPVMERIKEFRVRYPDYRILTEMLSNENGVCVFKTCIATQDGDVVATGHAYEKDGSSYINKTSYIENCETSSIGRALGCFGILIESSFASADEVANAMNNRNNTNGSADTEFQRVATSVNRADSLDTLNKIENQLVELDKMNLQYTEMIEKRKKELTV